MLGTYLGKFEERAVWTIVSPEDAQTEGDEEEGKGKGSEGVAREVVPEDVQGGLAWGHLEADIHQLLTWAYVLVLPQIHPQVLLKFLLCRHWQLLLIELEQLLKHLRNRVQRLEIKNTHVSKGDNENFYHE